MEKLFITEVIDFCIGLGKKYARLEIRCWQWVWKGNGLRCVFEIELMAVRTSERGEGIRQREKLRVGEAERSITEKQRWWPQFWAC